MKALFYFLIVFFSINMLFGRDYAKDDWIAFYGKQQLPVYPKKLNPGWKVSIGQKNSINSITTTVSRRILKSKRSNRAEILIMGKVNISRNGRLTANLNGENPGGLKPNMRPHINRDRVSEYHRWWKLIRPWCKS